MKKNNPDSLQEAILHFLYDTAAGRILLVPMLMPWVSKAAGHLMNRPFSKCLIAPFVKKNKIQLQDFEQTGYKSYNDFFTRKIRPECRPLDLDPTHLMSPCDSRLTVYPITDTAEFTIKGTVYTMESLLKSRSLAQQYLNGYLLLFRLSVEDYHRYSFVDDGTCSKIRRIPGIFHTVNPIALQSVPVYKENTREYSLLKSHHFGTILMMEVGAMMVGRIVNHTKDTSVTRGMEKGYFEFGGSTVILCLQKDQVAILPELLANSEAGIETPVKLGQWIGTKASEAN